MPRYPEEYAVYKGDEIVAVGTKKEIAEQLNIKLSTVNFMATKIYKERVAARKRSRSAKVVYKVS